MRLSTISDGEDYLQFSHYHPHKKYESLPARIVYFAPTDSAFSARAGCLQRLFGGDTLQTCVRIAQSFPWIADSSIGTVPALMQELMQSTTTEDLYASLIRLERSGRIVFGKQRGEVPTGRLLWLVQFDSESVRAMIEFNGFIYRNLFTGEVSTSLGIPDPPVKTIWIQCETE
jgi:hypothetical protein